MRPMKSWLSVRALLLGLCCLGAVLPTHEAGAEPPAGYALSRQGEGVTVFRREGSRAVDLYAEGVIAAPPERVRAVLLAYERHPTFLKRMAEIRVLTRGADSLLVYQRLRLPVIKDRDMVLEVRWGGSGAALWTRFKAVSDRGPPPLRGAVRVTDHEGGWRLIALAGGRATFAEYRMRIDLAGALPGWMARGQGDKDVPDLFAALRQQTQAAPAP